MMPELEESAEAAHALIKKKMQEGKPQKERPKWITHVALSTLIMSLLCALGALMAAFSTHESLLERTKEIIEVSYLEGDRVIVEMLKSKHEILNTLGKSPKESEIEMIEEYEREVRELKTDASHEEAIVQTATRAHQIFAIAIMLLSIGIALSGISVIAERRFLWVVGLAFGATGIVCEGMGFIRMLY